MSNNTETLGLFKYDTDVDKKKTFNINKALNDNWDKIDAMAQKEKVSGVYYTELEEITISNPSVTLPTGTTYIEIEE